MKERSMLIILISILLLIGGLQAYFTLFYSDFTFRSATVSASGQEITETLRYSPNKPYHTLYRNFVTPAYSEYSSIVNQAIQSVNPSYDPLQGKDYIIVKDVECDEGTSYIKDSDGILFSENNQPLSFTERNEYGCGFGNVEGFLKDKRYIISSQFTLYPKNLIKYEGKHYIKFFAYSGGDHPLLIKGKNLIVSDDILVKSFITPNTDLVMYVPFEPENLSGYNIIEVDVLDFAVTGWVEILLLIWILLPALACFIIWMIYGKEKKEGDFPEELSQYPVERKAWEVSLYYHPPFGWLDKHFLPTIILDFYSRKILSIQERKTGLIIKQTELFIKINPLPPKVVLDDTETKILDFLKYLGSLDKNPDGFFSIKKVASGFSTGMMSKLSYQKLKEFMKKKSKEHISYAGATAALIAIGVIELPLILLGQSDIFTYAYIFVVGFAASRTSLFIRFKDDSYLEYQQWQGFKKYLSTLDSMKRTPPQGVVLWEKYLVYATALGVGKKVLETMKTMNVINESTYNSYAVFYMPATFGSFSSGGIGGGGGGMGGGGIGGGGGGGR